MYFLCIQNILCTLLSKYIHVCILHVVIFYKYTSIYPKYFPYVLYTNACG